MLRRRANGHKGVNPAFLTDVGPSLDPHMLTDHGVGSHPDVVGQFGIRMHHGRRMDAGHGSISAVELPSVIIAINSASQTKLFSTYASPLIFQYGWRARKTSTTNRSWSPGSTGFLNLALS